MKYNLSTTEHGKAVSFKEAFSSLKPLLSDDKKSIFLALVAIIVNSGINLIGPVIIARTIDLYVSQGNFHGVAIMSLILGGIYIFGLFVSYSQITIMGGVGRRILFKLRNTIFSKLQELPVAFFNANKSGDLISRINNDTDKLNLFFSQALVQLVGNIFIMLGAAIFLISLNVRLGIISLVPALAVLVITQLSSGWIKRTSVRSLQTLGSMSAEIGESLANFKVVVAFNRLDYFRHKFNGANEENYKASVRAGVASNVLTSIYGLASNAAQILVLTYGIIFINSGQLTLGLLVGFLLYVNNFYTPLRQLASIWSSFQLALASLDRIKEVLDLDTDIRVIDTGKQTSTDSVIEFDHVFFSYTDGKDVLQDVSFKLARGKTYALVGPTGGGKTTTASIIARLFDPTMGTVYLDGKDLKSYEPDERARKIGFILQEPFLFTGTVGENILYGNIDFNAYDSAQLLGLLAERGLDGLLARFENGVDTKVTQAHSISLGQRQLIAFMRAVLRNPEVLILDEATANIDTVTEELLENILQKLPPQTTKIIIAHRLNTIKNADEIFALDMLMHGKRSS